MLKDVRRIYDENGKVELEFDPPVSVDEAIGRKQLKREREAAEAGGLITELRERNDPVPTDPLAGRAADCIERQAMQLAALKAAGKRMMPLIDHIEAGFGDELGIGDQLRAALGRV